jgi:hypothetical protein
MALPEPNIDEVFCNATHSCSKLKCLQVNQIKDVALVSLQLAAMHLNCPQVCISLLPIETSAEPHRRMKKPLAWAMLRTITISIWDI